MKSKEEIERLAKQLCNIPIDLVIDEEERYYKNLEKYDGIIQGYTQCQEDMGDKIVKLEEKLKLIEHISDEMAKDLIEQSEFFYGGFESVSKYYNYKQFCSPYKSGEQITNL